MIFRGFPDGSVVKNLPAMQEAQVQSLGQEVPLEEEMATHSSILAWEIPQRSPAVHGVAKSQTRLSTHTHTIHFLMWVRVKAMALAELRPSSKNRLISIRSID